MPSYKNDTQSQKRHQSKSKFTYAGDLESIHEEQYGSISNLGSIMSSPQVLVVAEDQRTYQKLDGRGKVAGIPFGRVNKVN